MQRWIERIVFLYKLFRRKTEPALNQLKPVDAVIVLKEP